MKLSNLIKSVVLGLAVLLATSAFASNKGSLHVQDPVEINGQQLPVGDYQLRWEGTGANVEVSVMRGNKEVAKTSAKVIELNQAPAYDTTVIDRSSGKASVSEVHFAGKKYALALGGTEKAEMGRSSSR
ncbi:MAG: hypothetical protein WCC22_16705 [Terriglobales bacterium]